MTRNHCELLLTPVAVLFIFIGVAAAQPAYYTDKINSVPDLTQTDPEANFTAGGKEFCMHCAVTNSLMWLDSHGFPNLADNTGNPLADQVKLAKLLASKTYMDTDPEEGTGTTNLIRGLKKFIADRGYQIESLQYQGWRRIAEDVAGLTTSQVPSLERIKQGVLGNGVVWLNVGWYKYDASKDEYERISGHWVTLVGYGKDQNDNPDPNIIILHDPSPRAGVVFSNEYVPVTTIVSGNLTGDWKGLPRKAAGCYKLTEGMHLKRNADCAVVDGAILLKLKPSGSFPNPKAISSDVDETVNQRSAKEMLSQAREMLRGRNKDTASARQILLKAAKNGAALSASERCHLYVYLGYIEDLAGNREAAVPWYRKALQIQGPNVKWIRMLAEQGLSRPITWIRHLDGDQRQEPAGVEKRSTRPDGVIERIGAGYVVSDEPTGLPELKKNLSKAEQLENFDILCQAIDRYYSFFENKHIDWNKITVRYRSRLRQAKTTDEFYSLMYQLVRELEDCHSWLCNYPRAQLQRYSPEITIRKLEDAAVVADVPVNSQTYARGIRRGSVIVEVDGLTVKDKLEQIRPLMKMYSSERAFLEEAYRRLLDGPKGTNVSLKFLPNGKNPRRTVTLTRVDYQPKDFLDPKIPLEKRRFVWFGRHSSGYGYIRILSFQGRDEIADEFDSALEQLKDTPGLIIDIRENPGGFGTSQNRIIGRLITAKTKVNIAYEKNGPEHNDFKIRETSFGPAGPWQYTRPVILLINTITGSASDLFACSIISTGRVVTIGTPTHGNLSGQCVYAVLPCGLVVRISNGYICDAKGRIIEVNGNIPDVYSEPTVEDIISGRDSVLERAVQELDRLCK